MSRRRVLVAGGAALAAVLLEACTSGRGTTGSGRQEQVTPEADRPARALPPTPACGDEADVTLAQTEGPYFTPDSPERSNLRPGSGGGTPLVVTGAVVRTDCSPVDRALVDVWQADARGRYDNEGYRLRGHMFTDQEGRYRLETILPGLYPGRTRHVHVKVQAPGGRVLTTQLYFPGEPANRTDGIFRPELTMAVQDSVDGKDARFDFVLEA
jgi:protocatechuate 3,4-dioxygenase beta subunit